METNDWVQIIAALLAGAGVKELWAVIRNKNNNETAITQHQLDIEAAQIEKLRMENLRLKEEVHTFENQMHTLKIELDRNKTRFAVMRTVVENLAQDKPELLAILKELRDEE